MNDGAVARVFVVDDDECIRAAVCAILKRATYECTCFPDVPSCLDELKAQSRALAEGCDLLITDVKMPGKGGLDLLQEVRAIFPWIPVIVMTAYGSIPMSVQAVKTGAFDFIEKPVDEAKLLGVVESALLKGRASRSLVENPDPDGAHRSVSDLGRHRQQTHRVHFGTLGTDDRGPSQPGHASSASITWWTWSRSPRPWLTE
jgi:two-component system response regulator FixJ